MLFSDLNFIFRALPLFLLVYYLVPYKARPAAITLSSLLFCAVNLREYTLIPVAAILINHILSLFTVKKNKAALAVSVILNASMLGFFKFGGLMIPLGMSYYTFKLISYQVDIYRGQIRKLSIHHLAEYILLFPQFISGPISRYAYVCDNTNRIILSTERFTSRMRNALDHIEDGLKYFIPGLFFKVIIADHLALLWNEIGTIGYGNISVPLSWMGVFVYSMNLYFDFWGYSLMAAGLSVMIGFGFIRNFNSPYAASSVTDFYRRWHITLGEWFKDYVYIPLGGSRNGKFKTLINLCIVWILTGLWHGISLNFFIWAGGLLILILCEKYILSRNKTVHAVAGRINVLILIPLSWIVFALPSLDSIKDYFMRLFGVLPQGAVINPNDYINIFSEGKWYMLIALILLFPGIKTQFNRHKNSKVLIMALFIMFWLSVYSLAGSMTNPFMYMSF